MNTRVVKSPEGFFWPQVEENGKFKFLVGYENWKDGKILTPSNYELYETPIAGFCHTKEAALGVIERYQKWISSPDVWQVV